MVHPSENDPIPMGAPGANANQIGIRHGDHVDYLQQGHLRHVRHDGTMEEHTIPITVTNPDDCAPIQSGERGYDPSHTHGPNCGHLAVPHGGHIDYLVDGRLQHPHGNHCDDHGPVEIVH